MRTLIGIAAIGSLCLIAPQAGAKPVNCQQIYHGAWLERTSDLIVEGTAVFDEDLRIRVTRTLKGEPARVVKLSTAGPGEDEIWFCPDYWQPEKGVARGRFYLRAAGDTFIIRYFEGQ